MNTLAFRNSNPLNIRIEKHGLAPWKGEIEPGREGFCVFESPLYGFRAVAKLLKLYLSRGINTPAKIVTVWAPDTENDTQAYIKDVVARSGLGLYQVLTTADFPALIKAMAEHESGAWLFKDSDLAAGIALGIA